MTLRTGEQRLKKENSRMLLPIKITKTTKGVNCPQEKNYAYNFKMYFAEFFLLSFFFTSSFFGSVEYISVKRQEPMYIT